MTAIAYRAGIMAADSVGWTCGSKVALPVAPKIKRMADGGLFAATGDTSEIERFSVWMLGNGPMPEGFDKEDINAIWAKPDGSVLFCTGSLHFTQLHSEFFAIGCPSEFMMGALFAGASAEEAVRLAIAHTDGAGGAVQVERVGNAG